MKPLAQSDLIHILDHTRDLWEEMRGERLFITGGTGFFGCWLLESFLWANKQLNLGAKATVLSRSPETFLDKMPHLRELDALDWLQGDVRQFDFPQGNYSHVIHAATEASARLTRENPRLMFDTIIEGTERTLEFAQSRGGKKLLLTSSGAVYGKQPAEIDRIPEDYLGGPDSLDPMAVYGEAKRAAEMLCAIQSNSSACEMKIARCFAFVGPHLPLDAHFAIGNFIRDGLRGGPIVIKGDGTPMRSYLYASDLSIWLWTILFKGKNCRPYNVGSDEAFSIAEVAELVANKFQPQKKIDILGTPDYHRPVEKYVPDIHQVKKELNLFVQIPLDRGIVNTIDFFRGTIDS